MFDNNTRPDETAATSRRWSILLLLLLVLALIVGAAALVLRSHSSTVAGSGGPGTSSTSAVPTHQPPPPTGTPDPSPPIGGPSSDGGGGGETHPGGGDPGPSIHVPPLGIGAQVVGPEAVRGLCPTTLEYAATVTVTRVPVDITYRWSGATAQRAHLTALHTTLRTRVSAAADTSGAVTLQVLSPVAIASNVAPYQVACVHASAGTATVSAAAYTGDCTGGHPFTTTATINAINGPVLVHYHWVRTDGAVSSESSVLIPAGASTATVSDTWRLYNTTPAASAPSVRGERLVVDDPFSSSSNTPEFTIWCI